MSCTNRSSSGTCSAAGQDLARDASVRRFIKMLLRDGSAQWAGDTFRVSGGSGARPSLPAGAVAALSAQGLVRVQGETCRPTPECRAWLRRTLAATDDYASQHRKLASGPDGSARDISSDPLEKLARSTGNGFLDAHHLAAGRRVCLWGTRAQLRQRITMSYDPAQVGGRRYGAGNTDITDMAAEARRSLNRLFHDLPRDCAEIIVDVCVFEKGLQAIETERGWPRRSAKLVLRVGLDQLAGCLGLSPHAVGQPTGRLRNWLDDAFQPVRFE